MFGQIAAANALSDVFAMGGAPKTALNIVGYPIKKLGYEMLAEILRGASDKVQEAGAITVGGHSIDDQEPKFGLAVTGIVHPDKVWKNIGAKPGDALVLTKPIGVGIMTTGIKRGVVTKEQERIVTETMTCLNQKAAAVLMDFSPNAVTDVTGFGLLGHLSEMMEGSETTAIIPYHQVPLLDGTEKLAKDGVVPGGSKSNLNWLQSRIRFPENMPLFKQLILSDAITSGGLLISLNEKDAIDYVNTLHATGDAAATIIGRVESKMEFVIKVEE